MIVTAIFTEISIAIKEIIAGSKVTRYTLVSTLAENRQSHICRHKNRL